jgi:hypothetical protein
MPKLAWLVKRYEEDKEWEIYFEQPTWYHECKRIVYFEIKDNE